MRTNQTIRRIFSILITLGMLLTFLPFSKQAIADGDLSIWYIFDNTPENGNDADFTIRDSAADPGDGSSWVAIYIDGSDAPDAAFDASRLDPRTELILNNAKAANASIYQQFKLLGHSRIDYAGNQAYTVSDSDCYFDEFNSTDPNGTMQKFLTFLAEHYYQDIGPSIATHITGYQELNEPCDYSYLVIDGNATLAITPAEGSNFDHIPLHIWNDLTVYGNLFLIPSWTTQVGIEFMDGATFIVNEGAAFQVGDGVFLDLHNRIENDFINLDPGRYVFDGNIDEWVNQQGQRNDGIYIGSEPEDLFTGISFTAMQNGNEEPLKSGSDEGGFISKSDYEEADYIEIKIFTSQPLFLEIYDGSDPEHREPLDPSLYDLNGSVLTIYKGEGEGADWFSVYDIWLKTEGIYFNYDREEEPIKNLVYTAGSNSGNVDNYYVAKSIYEDADSITFAFDISDPERDITIDVRDENDQRIDVEGIYTYANGELTINKTESEWRPMYNICIGVDHSQDPREDGISIGWDESTMVRKAVYEVKSGDNVLSSGDVDQEFIPRDQYDLDSADSIVITFDSDKSLVIEVFDDADPRHRLDQSHYAINGNTLTIFRGRGQGQEDQWFSSYEIWVKAQGIYLNYDHQEPPVGSVNYTTDNNYGTVTNYYISPNVYENEDSITLRFEILDQERGLTIDVRDENDDRIDEQSGVYEYADGALTIYKTGTEWGPSYNIFIGVDHSNDPREKGFYLHQDDQNPVFSSAEYVIYYPDGSSSGEQNFPADGFLNMATLEGAVSIGIKCYPIEGAGDIQLAYNYCDANNDLIDQQIEDPGRYVYFGLDLNDERSDFLDLYVGEYLGDGMNIQYDPGEVAITFKINSNGDIRGLMGNNISAEDLRSADSVTLYFAPAEGFSVIEAYCAEEGWSECVVEGESLSDITIDRPDGGWKTMNIIVTTMPEGQVFPDTGTGITVIKNGPGDVYVGSDEYILARTSTGTERHYYFSAASQDKIYLEITPSSADNAYIKSVLINGRPIEVENPDQPFRYDLSNYSRMTEGDRLEVRVEFDSIAVLEGFKVRLDDSIGVDYYIQIPEDILYEDPSVTFTLDSLVSTYNTQEVPYSEAKYVREGSEYYFVYSCEVTAADMTQPISATFKAGDLEVTLPTFTVRDYAKALIKGDDKTSDLARKLLNYGYYAQNKFAKGTQMFEEDKLDLPSDGEISGTPSAINTPDGVTYQGSTVVFLSGSRIRHYFQLEDGRTAVFEVDGQTRVPVTSGSMFYVTSDVINILDASIPKSVKISCDGGDPVESSYSVMDYIYAVIRNKNQNMSQEMIDLAKAFYIYHEAAANY
ncbi:MAG: hypothetical protein IJL60_11560 [Clostridiales bacterium]|nr:hypothetical protein [Clostridiales bacterium]